MIASHAELAAGVAEARRQLAARAKEPALAPHAEAVAARLDEVEARIDRPLSAHDANLDLGPLAHEHVQGPLRPLLCRIDHAFRRRDAFLPPRSAGETAPRRAILQAFYSRHAFRKLVLDPGERAVVGSGPRADFRLARDEGLGAQHLRIWWDGLVAHLIDMGSREGFTFEGQPRRRAELKSGDWFDAGGVTFRFFVEDARALAADAPALPFRPSLHLPELAAAGRLHAVLDASRDRLVRELLEESVDPHRNLYEGDDGRALDGVAPYLVHFRPDSGLAERLLRLGWGQAWGIYLESDADPETLRRAMRRLLMVDVEGRRERMLFRFYDPRVLRRFLPLATPRQKSELLADVDRVFFEGDDGDLWIGEAT